MIERSLSRITEYNKFHYFSKTTERLSLHTGAGGHSVICMRYAGWDLWLSVPFRGNVKTILHKNVNNFKSTERFDLKFHRIL